MDVQDFLAKKDKLVIRVDTLPPYSRRLCMESTEDKIFTKPTVTLLMSSSTGIESYLKEQTSVSSILFHLQDGQNGLLKKVEEALIACCVKNGIESPTGFCLARHLGEPAFRFFFNVPQTKIFTKTPSGSLSPTKLDFLETGAPADGKDITCAIRLSFPFITNSNKIFCACEQIVFPSRYLKTQVLKRGEGFKDTYLKGVA